MKVDPKYFYAGSIFIAALLPALPDTYVGSPRAIVTAIGLGLVAVAHFFEEKSTETPAINK